ncbi:MAG: DUF4124 domain-containing protein [Gammaproteobacteria bacterium]
MKALILLLLLAAAARAEVYKCDDGKGNVVYSQAPCGESAEALPILSAPQADPSTAQGLRPGEKAILKRLEQDERAAKKRRDQQRKADERIAARAAAKARTNAARCATYQRRLQEAQDDKSDGYTISEEKKLDRKIGEYTAKLKELGC